MQDAEVLLRLLQNHLSVCAHLTTHDGLWMPQYLRREGAALVRGLRASRRDRQVQLQSTGQGGQGEDDAHAGVLWELFLLVVLLVL